MIEWFGITERTEADRTLALAGLYQAAALVQSHARGLQAPHESVLTCIRSVLCTDPKAPMEVYGSLDALHLGFETLKRQFGLGGRTRDLEIARYVSNLIALERTLSQHREMRDALISGIEDAKEMADREGIEEPEIIRLLARTYRGTLSALSPRIMVSGEPHLLRSESTANIIRALLLAAIRSTVLWRQLGGSRRRLMITRRLVLNLAHSALNREETSPE